MRQWLILALGVALLADGWLYLVLKPAAFEKSFDKNLADFPLAASIASRAPGLRDIFLHKTKEAFDRGGWRAANGALRVSLATEVEVYADDEHINAISRAELPLLLKLEGKPLLCRSFRLAGREHGELLEASQEVDQLSSAHLAATENGFDRKTNGGSWVKPSDEQVVEIWAKLRRGPITTFTQAELEADVGGLDGDAQLGCSASIKLRKNLLALESRITVTVH